MRSQQLENIVTMMRTMIAGRPEGQEVDLEQMRSGYDMLGGMNPQAEGAVIEAVSAEGVPCEWITTPGVDTARTIVYVHGGGYAIGSAASHRSMLTHLSAAADARVLAVDYRLAPEHAHPAALDDAVGAYRWALRHGATPERTVIAGDSAGGGLTVATLVALRDGGDALPAAGVCLSPWVDMEAKGESMQTKAELDPMVNEADLLKWADYYLNGQSPTTPLANPLHADLKGLPPLLVHVGSHEVLLDDSKRLAERARAAGVDVTLEVADEMIHVWHFFAGSVPEADASIAEVGGFVRSHTN
ncbi:MAG: alpha/beta hydrolase [Acidimicrobiales bacterium]